MRKRKHFFGILFGTLLCVALRIPACASVPDTNIDPVREASLTVVYADGPDGTEPVEGARFRAYRIAEYGSFGEKRGIVPDGDGAFLPVDETTDPERIAEEVVKAYEAGFQGAAKEEGRTDRDGKIVFRDLLHGIYLVLETHPAPFHLASAPFIVSVPFTDCEAMEDGTERWSWNYEAVSYPKPNLCGDLILEKRVRGTSGEKDRDFHFVITFEDDGAVYPMTDRDGKETYLISGDTVALKDGEMVRIRDIPEGTAYTVAEVEAGKDGYYTVSDNSSGRIKGKEITSTVFTNERDKKIVNPDTGDRSEVWSWILALVISGGAVLWFGRKVRS